MTFFDKNLYWHFKTKRSVDIYIYIQIYIVRSVICIINVKLLVIDQIYTVNIYRLTKRWQVDIKVDKLWWIGDDHCCSQFPAWNDRLFFNASGVVFFFFFFIPFFYVENYVFSCIVHGASNIKIIINACVDVLRCTLHIKH